MRLGQHLLMDRGAFWPSGKEGLPGSRASMSDSMSDRDPSLRSCGNSKSVCEGIVKQVRKRSGLCGEGGGVRKEHIRRPGGCVR